MRGRIEDEADEVGREDGGKMSGLRAVACVAALVCGDVRN
jgi:hypothetical protein